MGKIYTRQSTIGELLQIDAVEKIMTESMPSIMSGPARDMIVGASVETILSMAGDKAPIFDALLSLANGEEVDMGVFQTKKAKPRVKAMSESCTYDIDDMDGQMYMLDRRFSGCLAVGFSVGMDESVYGQITCQGKELPKGILTSMELAGGMQMLGIPVRDIFTEYDTEYVLHIEGFIAQDGTEMEPQDLAVRTLPKGTPDVRYAEHDEIALQAAREGIVLLKNEGNVLPLEEESEIHVIGGQVFRNGTAGAGRINPRYSIGLMRGLKEYSRLRLDEHADTALLVISRGTGENLDSNPVPGEYYLTKEEKQLIADTTASHSHTIVVVNSGYTIDVSFAEEYKVDALIWTGYPGMQGGRALAEILDGRVNPSGKLPDTWSKDYFDIPASANFYSATDGNPMISTDTPVFLDTVYEEDIYVGYRYFESFGKEAAYPFGFGLSYTEFLLQAYMEKASGTGNATVSAMVKNVGKMAGKEVVQVYAVIPEGRLEQPAKRLVAFGKTKLLKPGEEQRLTLTIDEKDLASYDEERAAWIMEAGEYLILAGNSVQETVTAGKFQLKNEAIVAQSEHFMSPPVEIDKMTRQKRNFPTGKKSGIKEDIHSLMPRAKRQHWAESEEITDTVSRMSVEELARLSVCASAGWGMHQKGEAGKIYRLEEYGIPEFVVADGNNGVNLNEPNIGMPCSNTVCATFNSELAYEVGRVIAEEAVEHGIQMILAPGMNLHRNPLNGRNPEYFSEDPYLAGIMAGYQSKGLEDHGVSSCMKHTVCNNCESGRKRNHSILTERALRELYLKAFEVAMRVNVPDAIMTGYNACNGVFTAEDEEMIMGIFRGEFGFEGYVMTDWNSYDTADIAAAVAAGNSWMTPGSGDDTYVKPILEGIRDGRIEEERLQSNVRYLLRVVQKRTGADLGVK